MPMRRTRVYQIAKYFGCSSKNLTDFIKTLGFDIISHSSTLSEYEVEIVMHEYLLKNPDALNKEVSEKEIDLDTDNPFLIAISGILQRKLESTDNSSYVPPVEKIKEVHVESWHDFHNQVNALEYRNWIFRGQSDAEWNLETSLFRAFRDLLRLRSQNKNILPFIARNNYEMILLEYFKSSAHLYLDILPPDEDTLEWLAIMQHYGAPTRMLDFSFSPYVALFFSLHNGSKDSAVYCFDKNSIMDWGGRDSLEEKLFQNKTRDDAYLLTYEPKRTNRRLHSQQGLFLIPSNNYEPIDDILINIGFFDEELGFKFIIPNHLHCEMISNLKKMNISSSLLFPGIEGYTMSLKNLMLENNNVLLRMNSRKQYNKITLERE